MPTPGPPPPGLPADWPHRAFSQTVVAGPHRWHVQVMGEGPDLLLLHGAGGGGLSSRGLAPLLSPRFRLIVPDLPGQGHTRPGRRDRFGLDAMAEDLGHLCDALGATPDAAIGHSAGAALALRLAEVRPLRAVAGLNAALGTFDGVAGVLFPLIARALRAAPFVPQVFARLTGTTSKVAALLSSTGSTLDAEGVELYRRLVARPDHVEGALAMMAAWRLEGLLGRLPQITLPVLLLAGANDRTVPPEVSARAAGRLPQADCRSLPGLGHLMHEEAPGRIAAPILDWLAVRLP
ncbi:MAG TPA: alpha/beta fold hydrolase [Paracoccaceae bacterium]|nr:alpha/beta fold hydrolase [Paracoccaceae bacterium]